MRSARVSFFASFLLFSPLVFGATSNAQAASDDDARDVRLGSVQGDVRLSRGHHDRPDLKQAWEEAISGETLSQGFALATGDGRASIDLEDGSTIYLAENSLLLFTGLSSNDKGNSSSVTLVTGTATFDLKPQSGNRFSIKTPADSLFVDPPEDFHARIDAYLDATAVTPQGEHGETLNRAGRESFHFKKGESFYMSEGHLLESPSQFAFDSQAFSQKLDALCSRELTDQDSRERRAAFCNSLQSNPVTASMLLASARKHEPASSALASTEWDKWVSERVQEKASLTSAALKASGLSSPVPGLTDLYQHGKFLECAPYGTCWEPEESAPAQYDAAPQLAQNPSPVNLPNQAFPIPVEIYEPHYGICGMDGWFPRTYIANTPEELRRLLLLQQQAERGRRAQGGYFFNPSCFEHPYIFHRNRYVRLVSQPPKPVCHTRCKKHPPFPHGVTPVRLNGKLGFVPRHPDDKKGKPPANLKNGVLFFPEKPGQPIHRVAFDPSQKLKIEGKIPAELQREFAPRPPAAPAPEIHARLVNELFRGSTPLTASASVPNSRITYDYKSQKFMMSNPPSGAGSKNEKPFPVAALSGNKVSSFAGSPSNHSVSGFERSSNSSGRGSGYSGGGGSGGGHSGGSSSSGSSHSYGGGSSSSSTSGSSHSSGGSSGSGSSGSSASSSSSSGSSSSGGRPH